MKAALFNEFGGPDVLHIEDIDRPTAGDGEVLIQVAAVAYNPADAGFRSGAFKDFMPVDLPHIPGFDVSGTVVAVGKDVQAFAVGDRVVGNLPLTAQGAAAEFAVAAASVLAIAPTSIGLEIAAALPSSATTAWQALFEAGQLKSGQRVLINGAGGAVGGYAVQLAKNAGATVLATASERSADRLRSYGADQILDYQNASLSDLVNEPVDLVLNLAPTATTALVGLIRDGGALISTTGADDASAERDIRVAPFYMRNDASRLADLVAQVDAGKLAVNVDRSLPLDEIASVHQNPQGRTILVP